MPKRVVGFWLKAGVEAGIVVGVPVGLFVLAATAAGTVTLSAVPGVRLAGHSRVLTWVLLTVIGWSPLRCLLTDELQFVTQDE